MIQLRDYQKECIEKILGMNSREKKIAYLPTGAGKTVIMAEICRRINLKILIIVQSSELRLQTLDKLKMVCGESVDVGSIQGNLKEYNHKIIVATRQTLTSGNKDAVKEKFKKLLEYGKFSHVLFDEAHIAINQQKTILENLNKDVTVVGFTATPYSLSMREIYRGFIYKRELIDMIKDKYLVEPICYQIQTNTCLNDIEVARGDFVQEQLSRKINTEYRNNLIVRSYIDKCQADNRKKTIVFCSTVEHSKSLAECFCNNGIKAMSIDGSCKKKEREKILKDFHEGKFQVLCNVNVCAIGYDNPAIDSIIIARPTKSKALYIQQLGRGLRLSPETNKKDCFVIDVVDVINNFNIITSKTIFDEKDNKNSLHCIQQENKEKINKEYIENLENEISKKTNEIIEEIKNQENININNIDISYIKENILEKKDIKEKYYQSNNIKKYCKKNKKNINSKKIIYNLFKKIFKINYK